MTFRVRQPETPLAEQEKRRKEKKREGKRNVRIKERAPCLLVEAAAAPLVGGQVKLLPKIETGTTVIVADVETVKTLLVVELLPCQPTTWLSFGFRQSSRKFE